MGGKGGSQMPKSYGSVVMGTAGKPDPSRVRPNEEAPKNETIATQGMKLPTYLDPRYLNSGVSNEKIRMIKQFEYVDNLNKKAQIAYRTAGPDRGTLKVIKRPEAGASVAEFRKYYTSLLTDKLQEGDGEVDGDTGLGLGSMGDIGVGDTSGLA